MTTSTNGPQESHWDFLLACIKHTTGKPDFQAVAEELGLPSAKTASVLNLL